MKSQATTRITQMASTGILLVAILFAIPGFCARTPAKKKELARQQFDKAEQLRAQFISIPASQRSRQDYKRVTEAYRQVYYTGPTFARCDEAVVNVADFLAESGRAFNDPKLLRAAIGQYEFLRKEYPGSKFRVDALFAVGEIYKDDLGDPDKAKDAFDEFLKRYPRSHRASEARKELAEVDHPARKNAKKDAPVPVRDLVLGPMSPARQTVAVEAPKTLKSAPVVEQAPAQTKPLPPAKEEPALVTAAENPRTEHRSTLPLVTGIRHWSTPDYTRVAIDLETEVQYEAGRIANPDRIFFDLHDTKLSSSLVGKTFEVEDGFLRKIRVAQYQRGLTRVVLDVDGISDYSAFLLPNPYRLIVDIHGKKTTRSLASQVKQAPATASTSTPAAATTAVAPGKAETAAISKEPAAKATLPKPDPSASAELKEPEQKLPKKIDDASVISAKLDQPEVKATTKPTSSPTFESVAPRDETLPRSHRGKKQPEPEFAREARPTASGERSLTRALGLKIGRIVVDAGHGGHDAGTIGPTGLQEKDLVLDVALRLGKLLQSKLGADVVYTRSDDTFIPLENRTAIANQQQADLFISIHANSSRNPSARGIETYYLNFTSSADALEVAARENAVSEKSIHELQDLVKKITLRDKIDESREFAADVQRSLYTGVAAKAPAIKNRGVKKAPFIVLIGANMPSILAEISFISNPTDEKRLLTSEYRQKIAEYLYRGIDRYVEGLSGLKVAGKSESTEVPSKTAKVTADSGR